MNKFQITVIVVIMNANILGLDDSNLFNCLNILQIQIKLWFFRNIKFFPVVGSVILRVESNILAL